jgi:hypothetical protein
MRLRTRFSLAVLMLSTGVGVLASCERERATGPDIAPATSRPSFNEAGEEGSSTAVPDGDAAAPEYVEVAAEMGLLANGSVIRVYQDLIPWFGENRDRASILSLGKTLGSNYFIHPISALAGGVPPGTAVVLITSNSFGSSSPSVNQRQPAVQAALGSFLSSGGVVVIDMGDNDFSNGYIAPGATGTPDYIFPNPCGDASLTSAAKGLDGVSGTADDHPLLRGPDGVSGTSDDLDDSNIDTQVGFCSVAHGNLVNGVTLPPDATVLITARFNGVQQPTVAEYCFNGGRVILDTHTKEWVGQKPVGNGPATFLRALVSYALSPAAGCNRPPNANAGADQNNVECTSHHGAVVRLDGSGSSDPDGPGDIDTYQWYENGTLIATGVQADVTLGLGSHTITLRVTDKHGAFDEDDVVITVRDTRAPEINMVVSPTELWPPNHEMVKVASGISASDICDMSPSLVVTVTSNEPENGLGDGDTAPDWEIVRNADGTFDVWVRAERGGPGDGRVYTITATSTDASGNTSTTTATVTVQHDKGT